MSSFSKKIRDEIEKIEENLNVNEEYIQQPFQIEIKFEYIDGFRKGSRVVWINEEKKLYYVNSYSKKKGITACTCYDRECKSRIFIRDNGTAYRANIDHNVSHSYHYEIFKHMYCINKMKQKATTAPASTSPYEIYKDVLVE